MCVIVEGDIYKDKLSWKKKKGEKKLSLNSLEKSFGLLNALPNVSCYLSSCSFWKLLIMFKESDVVCWWLYPYWVFMACERDLVPHFSSKFRESWALEDEMPSIFLCTTVDNFFSSSSFLSVGSCPFKSRLPILSW